MVSVMSLAEVVCNKFRLKVSVIRLAEATCNKFS